jgi:hypothetical protein
VGRDRSIARIKYGAYLQEIVYAEARKLKHERIHQEDKFENMNSSNIIFKSWIKFKRKVKPKQEEGEYLIVYQSDRDRN